MQSRTLSAFVAATAASILLAASLVTSASAAPDQCPISVDGDAVAAQVRDELHGFAGPGGEHCMPLTVACTQEQEQVVVDFTDEFGRHVERRFESPAGAAAFLISWSRRPVLAELAAPKQPATAARWQPAAGFALVNLNGDRALTAISLSLTRHDINRDPNRYLGVGFRYAWTDGFEDAVDLLLVYGWVHNSPKYLRRLEAIAGFGAMTVPSSQDFLTETLSGLRTGVRAAIGTNLVEDVAIELGVGVDMLVAANNEFTSSSPEALGLELPILTHVGVQLRWGAIR